MKVLKMSENLYYIKYLDKVYKVEIKKNKVFLKKKVNDEYQKIEEFEDCDIEKVKEFIAFIEDFSFNHEKPKIHEALHLTDKEADEVLLAVRDAYNTNVPSKAIEYLYRKFKEDTKKLLFSLFLLGSWFEEAKAYEALKRIDEISNAYIKSTYIHKVKELMEKEKKCDDVLYR
ncbi:hypothetical protein [Methanocaldococcus infernus]|nr:hypothetical protein [Methanocaldococcus infernus]